MQPRIIIPIILFSISFSTFGQSEKIFKDLSVEQFKMKIDSLPQAVIIDLRTIDEVKGGIISSAIVLDYFAIDFENSVAKLDKNKTYLLYCAGGGRSGETKELMEKLGFRQVYNLESGFNGWKKQKMPVSPFTQ